MRRFVGVNSLVVAVSVLLAGCGDGDKHNRQAVSGTASIDGRLIPYGNVEFVPAEGQPTTVSMEVKDGKFSIDKKGGLAPGKYVVRIQGFDGPPVPPGDIPGVSIVTQPKVIVPDKYNAASKESVVVKAGDKNEFKFDLKN